MSFSKMFFMTVMFSILSIAQKPDKVIDVDGNVYTTVKIGDQVWTVENWKSTKYNDGVPIAHVTDSREWFLLKTGAYCFYDNDVSNKKKYGALYNWYAIHNSNFAPTGWRVPTDDDWRTLESYLGRAGYNIDVSPKFKYTAFDASQNPKWRISDNKNTFGNNIAKSMATKTDWFPSDRIGSVGNDMQSNNISGFSALPGGYRSEDYGGNFLGKSFKGHWWTNTDRCKSHAWTRQLFNSNTTVCREEKAPKGGFSVRLVYDKRSTVNDIDGNVYHIEKIGNQAWTVENLKTTKYNDGTPIALITDTSEWSACKDNKKPAYCLYKNDNSNKDKYGMLYNWYAVNTGKLAPKGWHVPTDAEWTELEEYLIANGYNWDGTKEGNKIAKSIASDTEWETCAKKGTTGNNSYSNNRTGFSALPGGSRRYNGSFKSQGYYNGHYGDWWSATEDTASIAWRRGLRYSIDYLYRNREYESCGFSVRLLRD